MTIFKGFFAIAAACILAGCASVKDVPGSVGTSQAAAEGMNRVYLVRTEQNIGVNDGLEAEPTTSNRRTSQAGNLAAFVLVAAALSGGDISASIGLNSFYYPEHSPRYNHIILDVFTEQNDALKPLGTFNNRTQAKFVDFPIDGHPGRLSISAYSTALFGKEYAPHFDLQAIQSDPESTSVLVLGRVNNDDQWGIRLMQLSKEDAQYCRELGDRSDLTQRQRHEIIRDRASTYVDKTSLSGAASRFHIACSAVVSADVLTPDGEGIRTRFSKHAKALQSQFDISASSDPTGLAPVILAPR